MQTGVAHGKITPAVGRRIVVVGTSGAGKTTTARKLSERLGLPHIELDALSWEPNWIQTPDDIFQERVEKAIAADAWVLDGNYSMVRHLIWRRADTIVWLDFSLPVVMNRVIRRSITRSLLRVELWNGNRESLRRSFLSRDSVILWALQTYSRRRRQYPGLFKQPEHSHLQVIHLTSPRHARRWLSTLTRQEGRGEGVIRDR